MIHFYAILFTKNTHNAYNFNGNLTSNKYYRKNSRKHLKFLKPKNILALSTVPQHTSSFFYLKEKTSDFFKNITVSTSYIPCILNKFLTKFCIHESLTKCFQKYPAVPPPYRWRWSLRFSVCAALLPGARV